MSRPRNGSTRRHRRARARLLATFRDGDRCFRCQQRMYRGQALDADHTRTLATLDARALPDALSHSPCNRQHGAALSSALRGVTDRAARVRIATEVTERVHHQLRTGRPVAQPRPRWPTSPARPRASEPTVRRVSSW